MPKITPPARIAALAEAQGLGTLIDARTKSLPARGMFRFWAVVAWAATAVCLVFYLWDGDNGYLIYGLGGLVLAGMGTWMVISLRPQSVFVYTGGLVVDGFTGPCRVVPWGELETLEIEGASADRVNGYTIAVTGGEKIRVYRRPLSPIEPFETLMVDHIRAAGRPVIERFTSSSGPAAPAAE